jgi:glucose-1-phosphate adenylyltransferase
VRDAGNLDAYWNANKDLTGLDPLLQPLRFPLAGQDSLRQYPPAKFVFNQAESKEPRIGTAVDSLVSHGCIMSGGIVRSSALSCNVMVVPETSDG